MKKIDLKTINASYDYTQYEITQEKLEYLIKIGKEFGTEISNQIYQLANVKKETDLEEYKKVINNNIKNKTTNETIQILKSTREIFKKRFGFEIRKKGESSNIEDQVIKRTGHHTREEVEKVFNGFNPTPIAKEIRKAYLEHDQIKLDKFKIFISELTDLQKKELNQEYQSLPANEIASILHLALNNQENFIFLELIIFIFKNRTKKEADQIIFEFDKTYNLSRLEDKEDLLITQIENKVPKQFQKLINEYVKGFDEKYLAKKIKGFLKYSNLLSQKMARDYLINPDFGSNLRESTEHYTDREKELRAFNHLEETFELLSKTKFNKLIKELKESYQISLNKDLYSPSYRTNNLRIISNNLFKSLFGMKSFIENINIQNEARLKNIQLNESYIPLEVISLIKEIIYPLLSLKSKELKELKNVFSITTGFKLDFLIYKRLNDLSYNKIPNLIQNLIPFILNGTLNCDFNKNINEALNQNCIKDIFDELSKETIYVEQSENTKEFSRIINNPDKEEKENDTITFLNNQSIEELYKLEEEFFKKNLAPLLGTFQQVLPQKLYLLFKYKMQGINTEQIADEIIKDHKYILKLFKYPPTIVALIKNNYEIKTNKDFNELIQNFKTDSPNYIIAFSVIHSIIVVKLKKLLDTGNVSLNNNRTILKIFSEFKDEIFKLEFTYNRFFSKYHYLYDDGFGTLLEKIKIAATLGQISRENISKLYLLFEKVDQEVINKINNVLLDGSIQTEDLFTLFRENNKKLYIIKKAFIAQDPKLSLRDKIYYSPIARYYNDKAILLLDNYDPEMIADKIYELVQNYKEEELGFKILQLITNKKLIPKTVNWKQETYHQIRLDYLQKYNKSLFKDLKDKNVPLKGYLNKIITIFYKSNIKILLNFVKELKLQKDKDVYIINFLKNKSLDKIETITSLYNEYLSDKNTFLNFLLKNIKDEDLQSRIIKLINKSKNWYYEDLTYIKEAQSITESSSVN